MASVIDKLGTNHSERYEKLLAEAHAFAGKSPSSRSWRKEFSKFIAKAYPSDAPSGKRDEYVVYYYLFNLTSEQLKAIRVACIGEEAERIYTSRETARRRTVRARSVVPKIQPQTTDETRRAEVDMEYEAALSKIPPDARTVQNLIATMGKRPLFVTAYLHSNPDFAARLIDGVSLFKPAKTG